jgi:hypothetical protein
MIDLVLHADRQQAVDVLLEWVAVAAQGPHANARRARNLVVVAGHGEAAFLRRFRAFLHEDLRVDEDPRFGATLGHVRDQQALVDIDLGGGEPDALGGIHGLEHVVDQVTQWRVDRGHRRGLGAQAGVWILQDCEARHVSGGRGACI